VFLSVPKSVISAGPIFFKKLSHHPFPLPALYWDSMKKWETLESTKEVSVPLCCELSVRLLCVVMIGASHLQFFLLPTSKGSGKRIGRAALAERSEASNIKPPSVKQHHQHMLF
jgi:hypothetical protein